MHLDVQDLRNFYYRSTLGRAAQSAVRRRVQQLWPETKGMTVAGFGFAVPLLRPYLGEARRVIGLMPGPQGVIPWPAGQPNVAVLCEEMLWPLDTGRVDRLIVMHGLETSENPTNVLDEAWRVLGPGGRALFIVPNRGGLWSRSDGTPFGFGRPYTLGQLESQLKRHGFLPERHITALYQPPSRRRFWMKTGALWERIGASVPALMAGGVLMVEASKRVHAPTGPGHRLRVPNPLDVLAPKPKPETAMGRVKDRS
jgi:SAM-dependent methyltransferase